MQTMLAVLGMSGGELVIVVVAVMVLFGARKIPEFAKGLGQGIKEFKKASSGEDTADKKPADTKPTTPVA
jgi:sec-independent protein translocase protein TatA